MSVCFATTEPERVIGNDPRTHYPFRLRPAGRPWPVSTTLCAEEHISVGDGRPDPVMRAGVAARCETPCRCSIS